MEFRVGDIISIGRSKDFKVAETMSGGRLRFENETFVWEPSMYEESLRNGFWRPKNPKIVQCRDAQQASAVEKTRGIGASRVMFEPQIDDQYGFEFEI